MNRESGPAVTYGDSPAPGMPRLTPVPARQFARIEPAIEIFEAMPVCIECIDPEGRVAYRNPVATSVWAHARAADGDGTWLQQWDEASRAVLREALQKARSGIPCSTRARRASQDPLLSYAVTLSPLLHAKQGWEMLVVSMPTAPESPAAEPARETSKTGLVDLLAQQLAEDDRQLQALRTRLHHAEKMRLVGHYVTQVVHDLNNVFHVLGSAFRILGLQKPDSERWSEAGKRALGQGTALLRRLLDFARREEDRSEPVDLAALLENQRAMLASLLNSDTALELRLDPLAWPVGGSRSAIESVVLNLVANARDAMPQGGTCTVELACCAAADLPEPLRGDYVSLSVSDTGCGIPPHILARAGESYNTTKRDGTGLGLASAYELAELASGCVRIHSTAGVGTRIALYLQRAGVRPVLPNSAGAAAHAHLHGEASILVAHPDTAVRSATAAALRALNYRVFEAPHKALGAALLDSPIHLDLIISDRQSKAGDPMNFQRLDGGARPKVPVVWLDDATAEVADTTDLVLREPLYMPVLLRAVLQGLGRLPALRLSPAALAAADKLRERLRNPYVRDLFDMWQNLARASGRLPSLEEVLRYRVKLDASAYVVEIVEDHSAVAFKVVEFGSELAARLGRDLTGTTLTLADEQTLGSLSTAWKRCLSGAPHFDYARFRLGDGPPEGYERLLLPVSADGESVTHLIGVTVFEGPLAMGPGTAA